MTPAHRHAAADAPATGRASAPADDPGSTPGVVIASVAAATVVVPFLIVYSFLFLARGVFVEVEQPDITDSRQGEALAGLVALVFLIFVLWGMTRMLNGRGRLAFWAGQALTVVASAHFLLDTASGQRQVPAVMLLAALLAIGLSLTPVASRWARTGAGEHPVVNRTISVEPAPAADIAVAVPDAAG